jgi:hypothetical protein
MPSKTIVAVAIGKGPNVQHATIISLGTVPTWARPYIGGIITGLRNKGHNIGTDYTIEYYDSPQSSLNTVFITGLVADFIVCLSTTVMRAAAAKYASAPPKIIGIVSHPEVEDFSNQPNVCGVRAKRSQAAHDCYQKLLNSFSPPLNTATVLHATTYDPSKDSIKKLDDAGDSPTVVRVSNLNDVQSAIGGMAQGTGVLLLPVDWFFGAAMDIIGWARTQKVFDFWSVTDWVKSDTSGAFGGYGVPQVTSGIYLAEQLHKAWNAGLPNPVWLPVRNSDFEWKVSQAVADDVGGGVTLNTSGTPNGPVIKPKASLTSERTSKKDK